MIFITLGTQDKPFNRLLEEVQKNIDNKKISGRVVVQAGCTKFKSKDMEIFDLIPMDEFDQLMNECDILITHGGVGSIVGGLKKNKKVIAVPRLEKYGEHLNDHQLQIINNFDKAGYIIGTKGVEDIGQALDKIKDFKPNQYASNTENMLELINTEIDNSRKKSVGIFTIQNADNYGGALQAYALRKKCLEYVDDVSIINYENKEVEKEYKLIKSNGNGFIQKLKNLIKSILVLPISLKKKRKFKNFSKKNFNLTKKYNDKDLIKKPPIFDKFIVGSDQVWNPEVTKGLRKGFLLDFIDDKNKKISYAASIASDKINEKDLESLVKNVQEFNSIGVREQSGKELLEKQGVKNVQVNLDPTLLLDKEDWSSLAGERMINDDYIFVYTFENDEELKKIINDLSTKKKLKVISFDLRKKYEDSYGNYFASGPVEFINYIKNAKYVVTNSFHATVFSLIFEKEFYTVPFKNRGSRMIDLLTLLGIKNRIVKTFNEYKKVKKEIDYKKVKEILTEEKSKSTKYLEEAISSTVYGNKKNCCGCSACLNTCPKNAIKMVTDNKGFKYPVIDKTKCINCGLCKKVCPMKNKKLETKNQKFYAVKNKDLNTRLSSSSGGVFSILAKEILDRKGSVYGAAYNDEKIVEHVKIKKITEIDKLRGSKYTQSDLNSTFKSVKEDLEKNTKVLFTGTPCQVEGLLNYLTISNVALDNLITVDIICHSVPSPRVFEDYKKYIENEYNSKIKSINFRNKSNGKVNNLEIVFENGKTYLGTVEKDYYYRLYFMNLINRDSCYNCKYKNINRISDITIGDYWGIENLDKLFEDKKGVSLVITNTEKGEKLFTNVSSSAIVIKSSKEKSHQPALKENIYNNPKRSKFWKDYEKKSFEKIYNKYDNSIFIKIKKLIKRMIGR